MHLFLLLLLLLLHVILAADAHVDSTATAAPPTLASNVSIIRRDGHCHNRSSGLWLAVGGCAYQASSFQSRFGEF